ncbi:tyrosine-type recombinase/integrase [Cryobacterium sp. RTS3]|uniref:tyrosine-type recombinase/integrase n=1 Tax=Cryobacterium sp. RTS3 TaxID=3048643 RepID=UPI002B23B8F2|nr:tyrosine-type recombinase/integrase [Cryobacterium sp. RTS3]MEB0000579.1 tyrosine-type recombinase/integrase [Cryobacterium sp. RTS3]
MVQTKNRLCLSILLYVQDTEVELVYYRTERAVLPSTGRAIWLVLDNETLEPVTEARDFALYLNGAGKSDNTIRSYLPRVASFLNWAAAAPGCDWRTVTLKQLARFKWSLEAPLGSGSASVDRDSARAKVRSPRTVNVILTAVMEFLRYCSRTGLIDASVTKRLVEPRYLSHMPGSFDAGERGQFRYARVKELRARETQSAPKTLTAVQVEAIFGASRNSRDLFLVILLDATAIRIGEALGLRRSDMHFLPDSTTLGCEIPGAHIHVVRRVNNANGALAKSLRNRHIPVERDVVLAYREARVERDAFTAASESDFVFVNLWAGQIGSPMKYSAAYGLVTRLASRAGVDFMHPHLFRHTAATRWIEGGTPLDVAQELLGHVSSASTSMYTHTSTDRMRSAVRRGAKTIGFSE